MNHAHVERFPEAARLGEEQHIRNVFDYFLDKKRLINEVGIVSSELLKFINADCKFFHGRIILGKFTVFNL
jgi:hypothetical protein